VRSLHWSLIHTPILPWGLADLRYRAVDLIGRHGDNTTSVNKTLLVACCEHLLQVITITWQRMTLDTQVAPLGSTTWAKWKASLLACRTDMYCLERQTDRQTDDRCNITTSSILSTSVSDKWQTGDTHSLPHSRLNWTQTAQRHHRTQQCSQLTLTQPGNYSTDRIHTARVPRPAVAHSCQCLASTTTHLVTQLKSAIQWNIRCTSSSSFLFVTSTTRSVWRQT